MTGDIPTHQCTCQYCALNGMQLPVKKTEKYEFELIFKRKYYLANFEAWSYWKDLDLTEEQAIKLREAISALVEDVAGDSVYNIPSPKLVRAIRVAKESFKESQ
jgi:hypothetical protein